MTTLARKGRGGKPILSLKKIEQPPHISPLPSNEPTTYSEKLDEIQRFEADVWVSYRAFRHRRQRGGLFGDALIRKRDADRVLKSMLADFQREGAI